MTLHTDKALHNILAKITLLNESKLENTIDFSFLNNKDGVKVTDIRQAIKDKKCLTFSYAKKEQLETKKVKPIQVFFYHLSWYLFGWPENETKPKFYRLSRIHELKVGNTVFTESFEYLDGYQEFSNWMKSLESEIVKINIVLRFPLISTQEVFDSFPETSIDKSGVDHLLVRISYPDEEWVVKLILSFGSQVEVLSPENFKNKIMAQIEKMTRIYFT
jgi:predicted DNA-binding transcriptional regulator YafY